MPWTVQNPPDCAKKWTAAEKKKCVGAANAVLAKDGTDEEAIFACIHAAGRSTRGKEMGTTGAGRSTRGKEMGTTGAGRNQGDAPGSGPGGECVCPECGHRQSHETDQPCNKLKCSECGAAMTRAISAQGREMSMAKKTKERKGPGSYPWDQCMAEQMEQYGDEEKARKVCGAIRAKAQGFGKGGKKGGKKFQETDPPPAATPEEDIELPEGFNVGAILPEIEQELGIEPTQLAEEPSQEEMREKLEKALRERLATDKAPPNIWIAETYDDKVVFQRDGKYYRIDYAVNDEGNITFGDACEEVERQTKYVPTGERRAIFPLQLTEDKKLPEWVPIHVVGEWDHPDYGHFDMTLEKMEQMVANFKGLVYRPTAPVNRQVVFDTRHSGDGACAWLKDLQVHDPLLLGQPDWTKRGAEIVRDGQYLYISPKYLEDPTQGPILQEVTLTNRNFLKELPPLDLPLLALEEPDGQPRLIIPADRNAIVLSRHIPTIEKTGGKAMPDKDKNLTQITLTIDGQEKVFESPEAVQKFFDTVAKETKALEAKLQEATKPPSEPPPPRMVKLAMPDGQEIEMESDKAVEMLLKDRASLLQERHKAEVEKIVGQFRAKNPPPVIADMMEVILGQISPEGPAIIQLEEGHKLAEAFGANSAGLNLFNALSKTLEQYPVRSAGTITTLSGTRPADGWASLPGSQTRELTAEEGQSLAHQSMIHLGRREPEDNNKKDKK